MNVPSVGTHTMMHTSSKITVEVRAETKVSLRNALRAWLVDTPPPWSQLRVLRVNKDTILLRHGRKLNVSVVQRGDTHLTQTETTL